MSIPKTPPTGNERFFDQEDIIVSKTDLRGRIRYANQVFLNIAGYSESEVMGQAHNMIRHPDMPACVFELLWETIQAEKEIFAYVLNMAKGGDHYWVFAHVTPSYDLNGRLDGYHSNRRVPHPDALATVKELYAVLKAEESKHDNLREGMAASRKIIDGALAESGLDYSEFVFSLSGSTKLESCDLMS